MLEGLFWRGFFWGGGFFGPRFLRPKIDGGSRKAGRILAQRGPNFAREVGKIHVQGRVLTTNFCVDEWSEFACFDVGLGVSRRTGGIGWRAVDWSYTPRWLHWRQRVPFGPCPRHNEILHLHVCTPGNGVEVFEKIASLDQFFPGDCVEIEGLLVDFASSSGELGEWLTARSHSGDFQCKTVWPLAVRRLE